MTTTPEMAHVAPLRLSSKPPTAKMSMAATRLNLTPASRPATPTSISPSSSSAPPDETPDPREDRRPRREKIEKEPGKRERIKSAKHNDPSAAYGSDEVREKRTKKRKKSQTCAVGVCPSCGFALPFTPASSPTDPRAAVPADGSSDGWGTISISESTSTDATSLNGGLAPRPQRRAAEEAFDDATLADAHRRIAELESQVQLLSQKATAAVDRCADYEDEITQLREKTRLDRESREEEEERCLKQQHKQQQQQQQQQSSQASPPVGSLARHHPSSPAALLGPAPSRSSFFSSSLSPNRLTALLSPRRPNGPVPASSPPTLQHLSKSLGLVPPPPEPHSGSLHSSMLPPSPSLSASAEMELLEALTREQTLRHAAEGRLSTTSKEVEELSSALFEQANEMVADERRARARLEERVMVLEQRDQDKRRRLERLESAMARIEKAREMLGGGGPTGGAPMVAGGVAPAAPVPVASTSTGRLFSISSFVKAA